VTLKLAIDATDILKFTRSLTELPKQFDTVLVQSLNETGDTLVRETTQKIAESSGFPIAVAMRFVEGKRASPSDRSYEIRVKQGMLEDAISGRPLPGRGFPGQGERELPDDKLLVNLVTTQDDKVCPICEQISREGPYSVEEFNRLREFHPHLLNRALHCRCALVPFKPAGRMAVTEGTGKAKVDMTMSVHDLVNRIKQETRTILRVKK
jgi:hypothetical protein